MTPVSLLFFSTHSIALPLFVRLLEDPRFKILGLVCQPDKATGRGLKLSSPDIKMLALEKNIPVYQPLKLREATDLLAKLRENPPDFLLTFAYGQILDKAWLELPNFAPLNVHPSLLPLYRGPTPIQASLLKGDSQTGLTLMKMVQAMDAGGIASQHVVKLALKTTAGELFDEMAQLAAELIPDDVIALSKNLRFAEQDESRVSFCTKFSKEDAYTDFKSSTQDLLRRFRAYTPWPGLWTRSGGHRIKLLDIQEASFLDLEVGETRVENGRLFVGTENGSVEILSLQLEGKSKSTVEAFLLGHPEWKNLFLPS